MSGTLKYTKLKSEASPRDWIILSNIKPHLQLSLELLGKPPLDTDFALERLLQYKSIPWTSLEGNVLVERGVSDFLESWTSQEENKNLRESSEFIKPWLELEFKDKPVTRELLVMLDRGFIQEKVLAEPSRSRRFPDVDTYLSRQSEYVKFTEKWNKIDSVIEIRDAEKFIRELKN